MTTIRRVLSIWIALALLVANLLPSALGAQESTPEAEAAPPVFILEPVGQDGTYFTVEMEPGTSQELTVALGNGGTAPVTALSYVADAYTLVNGGFGVRTADDPVTGATTWIDYPTETMDLDPGERQVRAFTVTVPEDAAPGQYIAGLSIQTAESIAVGDSDMLRQIIKKSIAIFIIVPGPETPELAIGEASVSQAAGSNSLVVDVRNTGNVYLNPAGTVTMTTEEGEPVLTAPVSMGTVYAGNETSLELPIPTQLAPGSYTVSVALEDEDTGVATEAAALEVTVEAPAAAATAVVEPVTVASVTIDPISNPDTDELQALTIGVTLENPATAIPSAQLTMHVSRDGERVEDYPLNSSLVVQSGTTTIQQRYVPLGSWEPGTYSFALTLESVDPATGQVTVLATHEVEETIEVP